MVSKKRELILSFPSFFGIIPASMCLDTSSFKLRISLYGFTCLQKEL
jgi:hypothetical protein